MTDFAARFQTFLDEFVELQPVHATMIGDHRHDHRWPDASETGRAATLAFIDRWTASLEAMTDLRPDDAIDRDLVLGELAAWRFAETELREDAWDPLMYVYLLGEGLFTLVSREFGPLADRLASLAGRLESMPALLDGARAALVGHGDRPVGRFQTETALNQLPGIDELIGDGLQQADDAASDPAVGAVRPRLAAAAEVARTALAAFEAHLRDDVLPRSEGDGRLGAALFAEKMRHTMRSEAMTPERILATADREFAAVRAEMVRLATEMWPTWCPDRVWRRVAVRFAAWAA